MQDVLAMVVEMGISTVEVAVDNIPAAHSNMVVVEAGLVSSSRLLGVVFFALLELASLSIYQALKAVLKEQLALQMSAWPYHHRRR